jgi:hypothetical protein
MRRRPLNEFWIIVILMGTGLVSFYFGFFYTGTVCDSSQPSCHVKAAFTPEPLVLLVGAVFFLFGLWMLVSALRRSRPR